MDNPYIEVVAVDDKIRDALKGFFDPVVAPLTKNTLYDRMTDAELEAFDTFVTTKAPLRARRRWNDATEIDRSDPDLLHFGAVLFGEARLATLLA